MILRLTNIKKHIKAKELKNLFSTYGVVSKIMRCPNSVYVKMQNDERAKIAASNLNGMNWKGNYINVSPAPITTHSPICRTSVGAIRLI